MASTCVFLHTLRIYKGASQKEVANYLSMSRSGYANLENNPSESLEVNTLIKLTDFYGLEDAAYTLRCYQYEKTLLSLTTARLITMQVCKEKQLKGFAFYRAILSQKPVTLYTPRKKLAL